MYPTAAIDWYNRLMVGWNLSDSSDTRYTIQAVRDTLASHATFGHDTIALNTKVSVRQLLYGTAHRP